MKQWDRRFGGLDNDQLNSLQQTNDGGYILGGFSGSDIGGDKNQPKKGVANDFWIIKIDSQGNKQWERDFGGLAGQALSSVIQATDRGYLLTGYSSSGIGGDKSEANHGFINYWVVKIDSAGSKQWDKTFTGGNNEAYSSGVQTMNGGFLIIGISESAAGYDKTENGLSPGGLWSVNIDSLGNKIWDKTPQTYCGVTNTANAFQSSDKDYVFAGTAGGGIAGVDKSQSPRGGGDYWVVKYYEDTINVITPVSNFSSSDSIFCNQPVTCVDFYDMSVNNPTIWNWYFPGGTPNFSTYRNPPDICYYQPGTYPVTLVTKNYAGSDTITLSNQIIVGSTPPAPVISVSGNDTLICSQASTYQWYYNGIPISGATDSIYIATLNGTYFVLITLNGCERISDPVTIPIGIDEPGSANNPLIVNPNPVTDILNLSGTISLYNYKLKIFSILGELIISKEALENDLSISVEYLNRGMYFICIENENSVLTGKFIKQ
jgi:PKD repeat protein